MGNRKKTTATLKHIHRIIRLEGGRSFVYKCADSQCNFLLHHAQLYHLIGRATHCFICGNTFPWSEANLRDNISICDNCLDPGINEVADQYEAPKDELTKYLNQLEDRGKTH